MRRILIGCGTALGNHLAATGNFFQHLTYKQAAAGVPPCDEIVLIAPSAKRLYEGGLGLGGAGLLKAMSGVSKRFIALSTINVYPVKSLPFDEESRISDGFNGVARTRDNAQLLAFEQAVLSANAHAIMLRLPKVFGPGFSNGLLKNLLDGTVHKVNRVAVQQLYPIHRLERDIIIARHLKAPVVNLCPEPIVMEAVIAELFPNETGCVVTPAPYSRIRTRYAKAFGGVDGYIMGANEVIKDISQHVMLARHLRQNHLPRASLKQRAGTSEPMQAALWSSAQPVANAAQS